MHFTRRNALLAGLFGATGIGLEAMASGVPKSFLLDPLRARAQAGTQRIFILSGASNGDPMNANVPLTYENPDLVHPPDPQMAPRPMSIGGRMWEAASPWANMPQHLIDRTAFIHHGTYTNSHANHRKVMRLMGNTQRNEMMVSIFAKELALSMETIQQEPISVGAGGNELLSFEGRTLGNVAPRALKSALATSNSPLADLEAVRDRSLDRIHAIIQEHGTENQRRMLDRYATSRTEARALSRELVDRLDSIAGNNQPDQVIAASVLAAMNVAPVISIKLRFGGDNHADSGLENETKQTLTGVENMVQLMETTDQMQTEGVLRRDVVFGCINVFGRTLQKKGLSGRDHNGFHHCTVLMGNGVRPSVVGGLKPRGNDWQATGFDSMTGEGGDDHDVPYEETFQSVAKTIGTILGVSDSTLDENITGGRPIQAAIA
ncbi:MAG: DUF1501 domain-containing protein [Myxococcota bacterium]